MKKGFTLVEIIISIGIVILIGTVSLVSFNIVKKNNKSNTLEVMSEEIYNAVNLYIETNEEIKSELYENANGVKIPLATLENSGLVDFKNLEITEDDYVVTMLGSKEEDDDHCANTYTAKSWNIKSGETIYVCEKSNDEIEEIKKELEELKDKLGQNLTYTKDNYYYRDKNNYLTYNNKTYQILSIEKDDSIILYNKTSFDDEIKNYIQDITGFETTSYENLSGKTDYIYPNTIATPVCSGDKVVSATFGRRASSTGQKTITSTSDIANYTSVVFKDEVYLTPEDILNSLYCDNGNIVSNLGFLYTFEMFNSELIGIDTPPKKIRLMSCMKITGGTGDYATPFILENKC